MKDLIYPLLKEDYVSPHLKQEEKKREIAILPVDTKGMRFHKRLWLRLKRSIKKLWK
ncbi:MAG: hypothetical protein UX50_C0018G0011 [Candidatus Beckwithbacteria bacterium GW2011_GWA1_46_30]|nr:MAG: hypothetical protein UT99_C0026G0011 [Candidatus Curtissbacteria bacterium GW2011_GWA2_40_31]KKU34551.1 MAG: hypothetical protein UX50_C0018G0011 [Candidatus Beckwithbacteria bacterium GW2011_GWA1_46_30]